MKRISKLLSLLMVMAMLFMVVPVSAMAAGEEETPARTENEIGLVLLTSEAGVEDAAVIVPAQVVSENPVAATVTGEKSEEPAIVTTAVEPETIETQAASYLCLTQNGVIIDVLATNTGADYDYDAAANELTLNNFVGETMDVKSTAVPFKLILLGTNIFKTDNGFAIDLEGDINFSGTGTLIAEGKATEELMGGGINVMGNLIINSGNYDITAVGDTDTSSVVGILTGYNDADVITAGNLTINGGNIDVTAYNSKLAGAFGLFAYGDLIINNGNIDVFTDSPISYSRGIGAYDELVFNGGYTTVNSIAENGDAGALFSYNKIIINNGILDLCASGRVAKALVSEGSIDISPIYGDVDLNASCLYLEPLSTKTIKKHHANPKTGVDSTATDAAVTGAALLTLMGLAFAAKKRAAAE